MKLTTFTDYCLRTLIYLAAEPGRRATIAEVAAAFDISENHLTKVVHFLGKQGWADTIRGKGGGLVLGRPAARIGIGDVVRRAEGEVLAAECFGADAGCCCIAPVCHLRGVLQEAVAAFHAVLDRHTLADIVGDGAALAPILFLGRASGPTMEFPS